MKTLGYALLFKKSLLDDAIQEFSLAEPQDLSQLCSATLGVCGNVWGSSNLEQVLSFSATFQNTSQGRKNQQFHSKL